MDLKCLFAFDKSKQLSIFKNIRIKIKVKGYTCNIFTFVCSNWKHFSSKNDHCPRFLLCKLTLNLWPHYTYKDNIKFLLPVLNSSMWHQYLKKSTSWTTPCRVGPLQSSSLTLRMKGIHSVTTTASQHCSPQSSG